MASVLVRRVCVEFRSDASTTRRRSLACDRGTATADPTLRSYGQAAVTRCAPPLCVPYVPAPHSLRPCTSYQSARVRGRKCDTAVKTNIAASANRNAPMGVAAAPNSPVTPASQKAPQATSWTISGAMDLVPQPLCRGHANIWEHLVPPSTSAFSRAVIGGGCKALLSCVPVEILLERLRVPRDLGLIHRGCSDGSPVSSSDELLKRQAMMGVQVGIHRWSSIAPCHKTDQAGKELRDRFPVCILVEGLQSVCNISNVMDATVSRDTVTGAVSSNFRNGAQFFAHRDHRCPWLPCWCLEFA